MSLKRSTIKKLIKEEIIKSIFGLINEDVVPGDLNVEPRKDDEDKKKETSLDKINPNKRKLGEPFKPADAPAPVEPVPAEPEPEKPSIDPAATTAVDAITPEEPKPEEPKPEEPVVDPNKPTIKRITKVDAVDVIIGTKGKIFTVLFVKKDGTDRLMNCRLGVKKYLKGGSLRFDAEKRGYLPVFDLQKHEYRLMNFNTLKLIKVGKQTYDII